MVERLKAACEAEESGESERWAIAAVSKWLEGQDAGSGVKSGMALGGSKEGEQIRDDAQPPDHSTVRHTKSPFIGFA